MILAYLWGMQFSPRSPLHFTTHAEQTALRGLLERLANCTSAFHKEREHWRISLRDARYTRMFRDLVVPRTLEPGKSMALKSLRSYCEAEFDRAMSVAESNDAKYQYLVGLSRLQEEAAVFLEAMQKKTPADIEQIVPEWAPDYVPGRLNEIVDDFIYPRLKQFADDARLHTVREAHRAFNGRIYPLITSDRDALLQHIDAAIGAMPGNPLKAAHQVEAARKLFGYHKSATHTYNPQLIALHHLIAALETDHAALLQGQCLADRPMRGLGR